MAGKALTMLAPPMMQEQQLHFPAPENEQTREPLQLELMDRLHRASVMHQQFGTEVVVLSGSDATFGERYATVMQLIEKIADEEAGYADSEDMNDLYLSRKEIVEEKIASPALNERLRYLRQQEMNVVKTAMSNSGISIDVATLYPCGNPAVQPTPPQPGTSATISRTSSLSSLSSFCSPSSSSTSSSCESSWRRVRMVAQLFSSSSSSSSSDSCSGSLPPPSSLSVSRSV